MEDIEKQYYREYNTAVLVVPLAVPLVVLLVVPLVVPLVVATSIIPLYIVVPL